MDLAGLYFLSYLLGSVPTAYLIGRLARGVDIRRFGSGNVGGSNLYRQAGKKWVVLLSIFEIFVKGAMPIWLGRYVLDLELSSPSLIIAPLLTVAGNNWSFFLRFQGGRGITVAMGTLLAISPKLLAIAALIGIGGWVLTRSSGIWVLLALLSLPVWALIIGKPDMVSWYCVGLLGLVVLKRLLSNWTAPPKDLPLTKVLFNRLLRDRDVDDRAEWVQRAPGGTK